MAESNKPQTQAENQAFIVSEMKKRAKDMLTKAGKDTSFIDNPPQNPG